MPERVPWGQVGIFSALALGGTWLIALPFHLGLVPIGSVWWFGALIGAMYVPGLAAAILVWRFDGHAGWARRLGLYAPGGWPRLLSMFGVAIVVPMAAALVALLIGHLLGWSTIDLEMTGYRETTRAQLEAAGQDPEPILANFDPALILLVILVSIPLGGLVNMVAAFGEELGWRGWLLPRLMPLGAWPAMLLSGALWGFWHAPMILLGYNYPSAPVLGVLLFTLFGMIWGVLHGWTRIATGSVWPATLMHGTINATAGIYLVLAAEGSSVDTVWVSIVGLSGWIFPVALIVALAAFGALPGRWREPEWPAPPTS